MSNLCVWAVRCETYRSPSRIIDYTVIFKDVESARQYATGKHVVGRVSEIIRLTYTPEDYAHELAKIVVAKLVERGLVTETLVETIYHDD